MNIEKLKAKIPYKWRVQSFSKFAPKATLVAYIDARQAMDLLDTAVGPGNWQDDYRVVHGQLVAGIGILCGDKWVWKWDVGTESQTEKEKGLFVKEYVKGILEGKEVILDTVKWKGKYGRFVAKVTFYNLSYPNEETDLAEHLVEKGMAVKVNY